MNTNREEVLKSAGEALLNLLDVMKQLYESGHHSEDVSGRTYVNPQLKDSIPILSKWRSVNDPNFCVTVVAHVWFVSGEGYGPAVLYRTDANLFVTSTEIWFKRFERGSKNV